VILSARWIWFLIAMLLFAIAWPSSQRLELDRSLERMFPRDDADRVAFERLEREFGVSHFLVFAYRDPELWNLDGSGIERAAKLRREIESTPGVAYALDLSRIDEMLATLRGPEALLSSWTGKKPIRPLLDPKNQLAIEYRSLFRGQTHAQDTDLVSIGVLLGPKPSATATKRAPAAAEGDSIPSTRPDSTSHSEVEDPLRALRALSQQVPGGLLVGHLAMVDEGFREIEQDGNRLGLYSTISLTLLMLIGFRSWRWAIIAIVVVQWSLVITRGILVALDWELTMVSSMLSSVVMVVAVATTMHWMFGYQKAYELNGDAPTTHERARRSLQQSIHRLWQPIAWACVTDAIGFASLMLSRVGPVQDYGSMMAIACSVVLVGIFMLIPTLALIGPSNRTVSTVWDSYRLGHIPGEAWVGRALQATLVLVCRYRFWVLAATAVALVWATLGSAKLKVETDFLKNFQADSPIANAYRAVETELGGAGIWDVMIAAPTPITPEYFAAVEALENELMAIEIPGATPLRLTSALSLADTDRVARDASVLKLVPIEGRLLGMRQTMGTFFDTLLSESPDGRFLRIMLRSRERSDAEQKTALIAAVQSTVAQRTSSPEWLGLWRGTDTSGPSRSTRGDGEANQIVSNPGSEHVVSGYYVLLTKLVAHVVADQWIAFLVATLGIALAMAMAIRSWRLACVAILPAVLPNMVVLGALGWAGSPVNLGAAMIAAVSMGLGIDSSLHYLFQYQRERKQGHSVPDSLRKVQSETGLAVLMATLALMIGFGSMSLSNFLPTVAFGTLAAWTMFGGLFGNLCLMPAILSYQADGDDIGKVRGNAS
jgi:uncharacterized protein